MPVHESRCILATSIVAGCIFVVLPTSCERKSTIKINNHGLPQLILWSPNFHIDILALSAAASFHKSNTTILLHKWLPPADVALPQGCVAGNSTCCQYGSSRSYYCNVVNGIDGDLRVSGEPLRRLPDQYKRHPTYRDLFGRSRLEVMPSAISGMRFSGKYTFHDYTLHFGLVDENYVLRASRGDRCFQLVPRRLLNGC